MELVNTQSGELIEPMGADEARRLTERIRIAAANYTEAKAKILALIDEARDRGAWHVLGYKSWTAYLADVLSDEPLRLARDERRDFVVALANEGMSTRAIAPIVGIGHNQVAKDIRDHEELSPRETVGSADVVCKRPAPPKPIVRETTGLDGKTRLTVIAGEVKQSRRVPRPAAERTLASIQSQAARAAREAETLTPDQIRRVRAEAGHVTASLRQSIEALQRLVNSLDPEEHK